MLRAAAFLFSLLCFVGCADICNGPYTSSASISYQIHSWNDLREWNQVLHKGATWFKIDPHYMNSTFCQNQEQDTLQRPEGCFVLSHDYPTHRRTNYNTTEDVIPMLSSNWFQPFLANSKISIALCFKVDSFDPCDGSEAAANWTKLVDELFASYSSYLNESGAQVEFILDGAGTAGANRTCLQEKWRPWNYTWIIGDDPQSAFYSNSQENSLDRFQLMNTPVPEDSTCLQKLTEEGNQGYGKFQAGPYPFLNWEPSDQGYILDSADYYLDTGIIHQPGFLYAINIDTVQFEVFAGSRSGRAWNYCLESLKGDNPLLAALPGSQDIRFLVSFFNTDSMMQQYAILFAQEKFGNFLMFELSTNHAESAPAVDMSVMSIDSDHFNVMVWYSTGSYVILHLDVVELELRAKMTGTWPVSSGSVSSSEFVKAQNETNSSFFTVTSSTEQNAVQVQLGKIDFHSMHVSVIGEPTQIGKSNHPIDSLSVSTIMIGNQELETELCSGEFAMSGIVSVVDHEKRISAAMFCATDSGSISGITTSDLVPLDVGLNSKIQLAYQEDSIVVLQVHGHGYCWNNERDNKRSDIALCDSNPGPRRLVLNYNFGTLQSWKNHIESAIPMSPCDNSILHGVYDFGSTPFIATFDYDGELSFLEIHSGVTEADLLDSFLCGMAVPTNNAFVVDPWTLPTAPK